MRTSLIRHRSIGRIPSNSKTGKKKSAWKCFSIRSEHVHARQLIRSIHSTEWYQFAREKDKSRWWWLHVSAHRHPKGQSAIIFPFTIKKLYLWGLSVKVLKTNISHNICACCAASVHHKIWRGVKLALFDHAEYNLVSLRQLKAPPSAMFCRINIRAH